MASTSPSTSPVLLASTPRRLTSRCSAFHQLIEDEFGIAPPNANQPTPKPPLLCFDHHGGYVDESTLLQESPRKHLSVTQLALATVCFCGVQFGWALQIAFLTPFVQELGLPSSLSSLIWVCGPISGFLVQPMVGVWSDRYESPHGRRRPFIAVGAVMIVISLLLISNSVDIGRLLGDSGSSNPVGLTIYVVGFWLLDLSNNTLQGPCRALLVDIAPAEQQSTANSLFSAWLGIGNVLGYLAGFVSWVDYIPWMVTNACDSACGNLRTAFTISAILCLSTVALTCITTKERPYVRPAGLVSENPIKRISKMIHRMPTAMQRIVTVQFFSWFAWFAYLIYISDWVAKVVFGGSPDKTSAHYQDYQDGVRWASLGLCAFAAVSSLFSIVVPRLLEYTGHKAMWIFGQISLAIACFLTAIIRSHSGAIFVIGLFGIPWSVTMVVPFALTGIVSPSGDRGLFMGVLNIFVVLPQLVMAAIGPGLLSLSNGSVVAPFVAGGFSSIIGAFFCLRLIIKHPGSEVVSASADGEVHPARAPAAGSPSDFSSIDDAHGVDPKEPLLSPGGSRYYGADIRP